MPPFIVLSLLSAIALFAGLLNVPRGSEGIAVIGVGCVLAIWARLAQAARYHREDMVAMKALTATDTEMTAGSSSCVGGLP